MAGRGRPKGSINKKSSKKKNTSLDDSNVSIPKNAIIWYEIWNKSKLIGWTSAQYRPGIESLIHTSFGDLKAAIKKDYNKMYFQHMVTIKPVGVKGKPIHITRTI